MKMQFHKGSALLVATALAILGLVIFQLTWIKHSRHLSEEIFNQRVTMALCSTVENYCDGAICQKGDDEAPACGSKTPSNMVSANVESDSVFSAELRKSLNFYQIHLDFRLVRVDGASSQTEETGCGWIIPLPTAAGEEPILFQLDFPNKNAFVLGEMKFMIAATVLILLFTTVVLLSANWALLRQKRLLQTNVDFFNNMAHEFRTPLTNVGLAAGMLARKDPDIKGRSLLEIIRRENAKLLAQVERILHLARLENGDHALEKENLLLLDLLQYVVDEMDMQIQEKGAMVSIIPVSEKLEVFGDRLHLGNVFRNLLDNALKYGGPNPEIVISVKEQSLGLLISIQDNGAGIPSSERKLIFQKFQRAGQGDLHEQKGFGLGLAYVKSMVEMHKGFVRVSSELNQGSIFEVFLPRIA
ncbi:MAG: HAMP domain-containing histidine kinase [Saprospiraceae bacterium]|nr:HAMP domain-containing histidine kinase [Saprospiraceae bacterium]